MLRPQFILGVAFSIFVISTRAQAASCDETVCVSGFVSLRGLRTMSAESWLRGGFGRLSSGVDAQTSDVSLAGDAAAVGEWKPSSGWLVRAHLLARNDAGGSAVGVTEAFVQRRFLRSDALRIRAGMFFPGTSRENIEGAWSSPYTITLSALNSWVGEEIRPIGLEGEYRVDFGQNRVATAATIFGGMDTAGALLAWRGWSLGNRPSAFNEVLPLPPLESLQNPEQFGRQRSGTKPFGNDLDGRGGWSGRLRWQRGRIQLQFERIDNNGDRLLHNGEYAWSTVSDFWSGEIHLPAHAIAIAEYARGTTGMGVRPVFVEADFAAGYILLSTKPSRARLSVRYDFFSTTDKDHSPAEINDEHGHAWTVACMWNVQATLQLGVEYVTVSSYRTVASPEPRLDSRSATLELRYRF